MKEKGLAPIIILLIVFVVAFTGISFVKSKNISIVDLKNILMSKLTLTQTNNEALPFLHVQGENVVDGQGNITYLRGFQGLSSYPISDSIYFNAVHEKGVDPARIDDLATDLNTYTISNFDLDEINSTGANTIRIWTRLHELQHQPYTYSETSLKLLENTINEFGDHHIYTVLVLAGLGQNDYPAEIYYKDKGIDLFNTNTDTWNQTVALWGVLAERFKENSYIAGYDIVNEPLPQSKQQLHNFYSDIITEIRKYDSNHIIILPASEKNQETYQIGGTYTDTNIMATFHFYYPVVFTQDQLYESNPGLVYPGTINNTHWDKNTLISLFDRALALSEIQNMPVYVGEFGADGERDDSGALQWVDDVMSLMNERHLHYTMHTYKHRHFYGYWIMKQETAEQLDKALTALSSGNLHTTDITNEQKQIITTEKGYYLRPDIKPIVTKYFQQR